MGALAAGGSLAALGTASAQKEHDEDNAEDWLPPDAAEAHVAALSGSQADVDTNAGGCAHIMPQEEDTLSVDLVLEDIQCVTQAHIHEGARGEDGPVVAPLLEYTENPDGTGAGDPLTTTPDTPLIEGATVDDPELVADILANPDAYYVNVHTTHHPEGAIRGQIRGFDLGQQTELEPQPADFRVANLDPVEATVTQGDRIDVSATVRNAGDITDTQTIEFRIDGDVIDQQTLELGCRQARTVTFTDIDTADLEPGEYTHGIFSEDDSATGTLTITEVPPAEFLVSDLDPAEATVTQGDVIDVSATIENVGEQEGTQTLELRIGEELDPDDFVTVHTETDDTDTEDEEPEYLVVLEQELTLGPSEEEEIVFEGVDTEELEPDEYEHGIFSQDDSETGTLTVEAEEVAAAEFSVFDLDPVDVTVTQGDIIDVQATIENTGGEEGTQTVEFRVDGDPLAEQELTLGADESELVIFTDIDTAPLEPGDYEHGIFTEDDSETGTLTVQEEEVVAAEFTVSDLDPMDVSVPQGTVIDVSATIENVGEEEGTQTVEFRVDGDPLAEQEVTLGAGDSEPVTFGDIDTSPLEPGEYEHGVFTDDDSQTATLTIEEEEPAVAEFSVFDLDPVDVTVTQGDIIDVQATIENTGGETGTQTVQFRVDDNPLVDEELGLEPGESELVIFTDIDTAPLEPGDYEHGIFTDDDSETGTLTVEAEENGNNE